MARNVEIELTERSGGEADVAAGSVFFVGTATVIIRFAGFTIMTDPNFLHAGDHVHLGYGLTSERLTEPALDIEDLPPIDLCALSHYHGDHFDQIVEEKLRRDLPIVTTEHAAAELRSKGFTNTVSLDTWDTASITNGAAQLRITSTPGRHGPGVVQIALPPVMGSILDFETLTGGRLFRMYITGDTLVYDEIREIPKRFPDVNLALVHLGGTRVLGILVTMDDKQGVEMLEIIRPEKAIPIHYNDYGVFMSPLDDFKRAAEEAGMGDMMVYLEHGETYTFRVRGGTRAAEL